MRSDSKSELPSPRGSSSVGSTPARNRTLAVIGVLLAGAALLTAVIRSDETRPSPSQVAAEETIAVLSGQIANLQQDQLALLKAHRQQADRLAVVEQTRTAAGAPVELGPIRQRLDEHEARLAQLGQSAANLDRYGLWTAMERELVDAYQTVLDESQPLKVRLKNIENLKKLGHIDARVEQSLLKAFTNTADLNEKSGVLQALAGTVKTPQFRDQIIVSLNAEIQAGNASPRYRYYAIEALEPMLPDPLVRDWLFHLAQSDPETKIAHRAGEAIGITPPTAENK